MKLANLFWFQIYPFCSGNYLTCEVGAFSSPEAAIDLVMSTKDVLWLVLIFLSSVHIFLLLGNQIWAELHKLWTFKLEPTRGHYCYSWCWSKWLQPLWKWLRSRNSFCMDLASPSPYCHDLTPIFLSERLHLVSKRFNPEDWLIWLISPTSW